MACLSCRKNYNPNMKGVGNQYYDHVPDKIGETTVWDHVVKGERMKIFHQFDKDSEFLLPMMECAHSLVDVLVLKPD